MHKRAWAILSFALLLALTYRGYTQPQTESQSERFRRMSLDAESRGLAEPFKGITTNGTVQPGLYTIRSTGVSTETVRKAADAFLAALHAPVGLDIGAKTPAELALAILADVVATKYGKDVSRKTAEGRERVAIR